MLEHVLTGCVGPTVTDCDAHTRPSTTSLHLVVSFLMEAILFAKEPSEKARNAAFALLVTMGRKMKDGRGSVDVPYRRCNSEPR